MNPVRDFEFVNPTVVKEVDSINTEASNGVNTVRSIRNQNAIPATEGSSLNLGRSAFRHEWFGRIRPPTKKRGTHLSGQAEGFTILELLVVIAIISILAGLVIPNVIGSKTRAKITTTKSELQLITGAMEHYYMVFGDYPPTSLEGFKKNLRLNPTNQGIESLVACLSTQSRGGPFLGQWKERRYTNLDNDNAPDNLTDWWFGDNQLRELVDLWLNPFVYFHPRDYEAAEEYSRYINKLQTEFIALPQKSTLTNAWHNPFAYQLWSLGPNEENDDGAKDDIPNW